MTSDTFLTWPNLATFSGAVAAVVFLVQFLKVPLDKLKHVPTRIVVYLVSFLVLLAAKLFTEPGFSVETVALSAVNAVLVALTSMSLYEQTIAEPEATKNQSIVDDTAQALADIVSTVQHTNEAATGDTNATATDRPPTTATDRPPTTATDAIDGADEQAKQE